MLASLLKSIRRTGWWQVVLIPIYALIYIVFAPIGWVLKELGGQAKTGAKKVFAPLLWPIVAIVAAVLLISVIGIQGVDNLLNTVVPLAVCLGALLVMLYGLKMIVTSPWTGSKKKGRRR